MATNSRIEWTGSTWNPVVGCAIVSPGCTNCYAMRHAARLERMGQDRYAGLTKPTKAGAVWTGETRLVESALTLPLRTRKPTTWFVNSMADLFAESVPDEWIDRVFAVMALCPQHIFQVLTKRSARMRAYLTAAGTAQNVAIQMHRLVWADATPHGSYGVGVNASGHGDTFQIHSPGEWPLRHVWLGVSAEDQRRADERVPDLLATPAAVRFVSAEPLLGPIDFTSLDPDGNFRPHGAHGWSAIWKDNGLGRAWLDWLIVGGESGPGARPMHPDWARQIRDACAALGVPYFFKQWGAWAAVLDRDRDDPDWRSDYSDKLNDRRPEIAWLNLAGGRGFHGERFHVMRRVGKAAAGRLLDGVEHNGMPEASSGLDTRDRPGIGPGEARQQQRTSASPAPALDAAGKPVVRHG